MTSLYNDTKVRFLLFGEIALRQGDVDMVEDNREAPDSTRQAISIGQVVTGWTCSLDTALNCSGAPTNR